jgi:hypothetical protein
MFFPDAGQALREMARVVRDEGVVAVQVWNRLEAQPAYQRFADVAARHAGPEARSSWSVRASSAGTWMSFARSFAAPVST